MLIIVTCFTIFSQIIRYYYQSALCNVFFALVVSKLGICVQKNLYGLILGEVGFERNGRTEIFENEEELLKEMKEEPEYKQYFE